LRDRCGADDPLDVTPEQFTTWDELQPQRAKVRGWLRRVIDETSDDEMVAQDQVMRSGMMVSRAEVLEHILLHERGHHGDISTLIERVGGAPGASDYLVYMFFRRRRG
jgi:uncharacterized damage-inducible protein DinB